MKTTNELIARTEAALAALKETAAGLPPELQTADILVTHYGGHLTFNARNDGTLKAVLAHFGREGWTIGRSYSDKVTAERTEPNGVRIVIENIPTSTPAIGSDATPYLH